MLPFPDSILTGIFLIKILVKLYVYSQGYKNTKKLKSFYKQ